MGFWPKGAELRVKGEGDPGWAWPERELRYFTGPPSELEYVRGFGMDWPVAKKSPSGVLVTEETAIRHAAVYACVRVLSETHGALPMRVARRLDNGGVEVLDNHPVDYLLHRRPNSRMTPTEFKRSLVYYQEMRGNAWVLIARDSSGSPVSLIPVHPNRVKYEIRQGRELIEIEDETGEPMRVDPMDIIHLPHMVRGESGLGESPVRSSAISLGIATTEAAERFYGEGYRQTGVISHPGVLKKGTGETLAKRMEEKYKGVVHKGFGLMVLDEGMQYQQVGLSAEDAALLDSIKATKADIAAIFRVPLLKLQDLTDAHYNNAEHNEIEFRNEVKLTRAIHWEEEFAYKLLSQVEQASGVEVWFNMNEQNRADTKSQTELWSAGVQHGWESPNSILGRMGQPPVEHGDDRYRPANLLRLGEDPPEPAAGGGGSNNGSS